MAITALEFMVLTSFREHGALPHRPRVLELGRSNWYGDVPVGDLEQEIHRLNTDPAERDRQLALLLECTASGRPTLPYELAEIFFDAILQAGSYAANDPGEPTARYRFDLNQPTPITERFDLLLNIGTAEHVFNVCQFFKTAHDLTLPHGIMMHSSPFTGWPDHGFFNFQPTFFFDLARANQYEILSFICARIHPFEYVQVRRHEDIPHLLRLGKIPGNAHINVLFRKTGAMDFVVPTQGYYAGTLSPELRKAWHDLR